MFVSLKTGGAMFKKMLYVVAGFVFGFIFTSAFFIPELRAQWGSGITLNEKIMQPTLPANYGKLVGVSGITMYFQAENGNVYIVNPRTDIELDPAVTVIKRS